jgi:hypothetical protein
MHFLDETSFQDVAHIDDLFFLRDTQISLGILSSCVTRQPSHPIWTIPPSSSFLFFLASFDWKIMHACRDIMGLRSWESIQGP